jgi:hypothetical protein
MASRGALLFVRFLTYYTSYHGSLRNLEKSRASGRRRAMWRVFGRSRLDMPRAGGLYDYVVGCGRAAGSKKKYLM